jgi:hypothetical protein
LTIYGQACLFLDSIRFHLCTPHLAKATHNSGQRIAQLPVALALYEHIAPVAPMAVIDALPHLPDGFHDVGIDELRLRVELPEHTVYGSREQVQAALHRADQVA